MLPLNVFPRPLATKDETQRTLLSTYELESHRDQACRHGDAADIRIPITAVH
jgi:hypothetical protein